MDAVLRWFAAMAWLSLAAVLPAAQAQSTDGYHAIQVFPLVVDTASFTQRFHFRAAEPWEPFDVTVRYYPATGTAQATPLDCPSFTIPVHGERRFTSLRELCPGLPAGSAFGAVIVSAQFQALFAAYSRVSNLAGAGFSVESFPANTFTSADTAVTGLRRLAPTAGTPAFQSNCFVGNLGELAPSGPATSTTVAVQLLDAQGLVLGSGQVDVAPGEIVRILDVFAWANAAPVDRENVVATFSPVAPSIAGLLTYCTVQDNSSYAADFRIGKQESAFGGTMPGAQDGTATRWTYVAREMAVDQEIDGAILSIPAGASRNVHVFYFHHPDVVNCNLIEHWDYATPAYGLELRLRVRDANGWQTLAGGNDAVGFSGLYLGDKRSRGGGANTAYQVEVESNGQNDAVDRPYVLACTSGSGHTPGELIRKELPTAF
jgi:hypothetical protein